MRCITSRGRASTNSLKPAHMSQRMPPHLCSGSNTGLGKTSEARLYPYQHTCYQGPKGTKRATCTQQGRGGTARCGLASAPYHHVTCLANAQKRVRYALAVEPQHVNHFSSPHSTKSVHWTTHIARKGSCACRHEPCMGWGG